MARIIGVLVGGIVMVGAVAAQDWPQWRGPNRDAKVTGFTPPKVWPKELTKNWDVKVGTGVSSPVLVGEKAYAFGRIGGEEVTTCVDADSGKIVWQDKYSTDAITNAARGYAGPRATPCVADGRIFTLGVNGTISCLEAKSGNVIWRKDTGEKPQFHTSSSPLVADGKCVVFLDALRAYDAASGAVKWTGPKGTPYGSPILMTVGGVKQVVTPTVNSLVGVNLADGKELWQVKLPSGSYSINYGTPIIDGQMVIFTSPGKGGGAILAVKIDKKGDGFTATEEWKGSGSYQYNTPVLKDGLLFGLSPSKYFFCMDAKSGKALWTDNVMRGEAGGVLSAGSVIVALTGPAPSPGKAGGKGFGFRGETATGDAELTLFEASAKGYKELAKYKLTPGSGLAYPIIAGNRIVVKGNDALTLWTMD